jgi:hypothetical protein
LSHRCCWCCIVSPPSLPCRLAAAVGCVGCIVGHVGVLLAWSCHCNTVISPT